MDLLVVQLKAAIRKLLELKGVRARVLDKVNRYGEVVIGIILERPPGTVPPGNTPPSIDDASTSARARDDLDRGPSRSGD